MQHKWFIEVVISLCPSKCCKIAEFRLSSNCRDHLDPAQAEPSVNDRGQSIPPDGRCQIVVHVQPLPRVDYRSQFGGRCRVEQKKWWDVFFATTANGDAGLHKNSKNISLWFVKSWDSNTMSCYCTVVHLWNPVMVECWQKLQDAVRVKKVELIIIIWFGLDHHCRRFNHVVTVGDQRKPVFCANFLDPIPSLAPARDYAWLGMYCSRASIHLSQVTLSQTYSGLVCLTI